MTHPRVPISPRARAPTPPRDTRIGRRFTENAQDFRETTQSPHEAASTGTGGAFVGGSIGEVRLYQRPRGRTFWAVARLRSESGQEPNVIVGDVQVIDETGAVISESLEARLWYLSPTDHNTLSETDRLLYELHWEPKPLTVATASLDASRPANWLIFADLQGVGAALATKLAARGESSTLVYADTAYAHDDDRWALRPGQPEDMQRLFAEQTSALRGIVHLWSLDAPALAQDTGSDLDRAGLLGSASAIHVIQRVARANWQSSPRLWLVTSGAQHAAGAPTAPEQAPLWGLGRTVALEHSELWGGLIDLDPFAATEVMAEALSSQLTATDTEDQVAFREGQRYVARLIRARAPSAVSEGAMHADAGYLVTGGLGGLGLQVATWLIGRGARHLVLLGRSALPERSAWKNLEPASPQAMQARAIQALEAQGARIYLVHGDVGDAVQLQVALKRATQEGCPELRGVVHAAGILAHQSLLDATVQDLATAMRAKVQGAWLLHQLLPELDFFVLFSSASALLSSPRLAGYAAANAFLDALAHVRRAQGKPALSINWGVWSEVGMATRFEAQDVDAITQRGMGTLRTEQALAALEHLLEGGFTHAAVLPVDWARWQKLYPAFVAAPLLSHLVQRNIDDSGARADDVLRQAIVAAGGSERATLVEDYLAAQAARVLGLEADALDRHQPLGSFGLDSLMAVELKNRVETDLAVVVPMVRFLEGPTTRELAMYVLSLLDREAAPAKPMTLEAALEVNVDDLSEAELDRMLTDLLAQEASKYAGPSQR